MLTLCRCRAFPEDLDKAGKTRFKAHTDCLIDTFPAGVLWDVFGINVDVLVSRSAVLTVCVLLCMLIPL